jgi:O-antigen ligase
MDHIVRSQWALQYIIQSPSGVGMGMVWPKGAALLMETEALYHIEGSLFQIAFEWGLWGFAVWMAFIGIALVRIWKAWVQTGSFQVQVHLGTAFLGWVGTLVVLIFLPLMQSINLMVLLWYLLGLGVGLAQVIDSQSLGGSAEAGEVM